MNHPRFHGMMKELFIDIEVMLSGKANEYASDYDRLHNFKQAAHLNQQSPISALWGFVTKQIVALSDYVKRHEMGEKIEPDMWYEKYIDIINYMIILHAMISEEYQDYILKVDEGIQTAEGV